MSSLEHITFWRDPSLSNLELLHATYVTHSFIPHTHEEYVIAVIEKGAQQFNYRRHRHIAPTGNIVLINPGEVHTGSAAVEQGWTYRAMYPATGLLQRAASELVGHERSLPFFTEPSIYDPEMAVVFSLLHRSLEGPITALERESRLLWALAHLILRHADDHPQIRPLTKEHAGIQRVRAYLDEHYAENVSLADLAALAHLSPFHLLRAFREHTHLPPHTYQIQARVMRARSLLKSGMSCAETALAVGFADQSHLTKHFKRILGVPPGLYRTEFSRK